MFNSIHLGIKTDKVLGYKNQCVLLLNQSFMNSTPELRRGGSMSAQCRDSMPQQLAVRARISSISLFVAHDFGVESKRVMNWFIQTTSPKSLGVIENFPIYQGFQNSTPEPRRGGNISAQSGELSCLPKARRLGGLGRSTYYPKSTERSANRSLGTWSPEIATPKPNVGTVTTPLGQNL